MPGPKSPHKTPPKRTTRKSNSESSPIVAEEPSPNAVESTRKEVKEMDEKEGDDFEIKPDKAPQQAPKRRSSTRRDSVSEASKDAEFRKPFKLGWGRELVVYGKPGTEADSSSDVFYFSPEGKKLRNMKEVKAHLLKTKSTLRLNYFTFKTKTVYEEPFEIVRHSGKPKKKVKQDSLLHTEKDEIDKSKGNKSENLSDTTSKRRRSSMDEDKPIQDKKRTRRSSEKVFNKTEIDEFLTLKPKPSHTMSPSMNIVEKSTSLQDESAAITKDSESAKYKKSSLDNKLADDNYGPSKDTKDSNLGCIESDEKSELAQATENAEQVSRNDEGTESEPISYSKETQEQGKTSQTIEKTNESLFSQSENAESDLGLKISAVESNSLFDWGESEQSLKPTKLTAASSSVIDSNEPDTITRHTNVTKQKSDKKKSTLGKLLMSNSLFKKRPKANVKSKPMAKPAKKFNLVNKPLTLQPRPMKVLGTVSTLITATAAKKITKSLEPNIDMEGKEEQEGGEGSTPKRRRRALPARLRDYAVDKAKSTEESEAESLVAESGEELEDEEPEEIEEPAPTISSMNPTNVEILQAVVQARDTGNAKKQTDKRKSGGGSQPGSAKKKKTDSCRLQQSKEIPTIVMADRKLCGLDCKGMAGIPPSLQCDKCICLFHPRCVNLKGTTLASFTCPECRLTRPPVKIKLPFSLGSGSSVQVVQNLAKTTQARAGTTVKVISARPVAISSVSSKATPAEPWEIRDLRSNNDKVNRQIVNLPKEVARKLDLKKGIKLKYNGLMYDIPASCVEMSGTSVKLLLPPNTLPHYISQGGPDNPVSISAGRIGSNQLTMFQLNQSYFASITASAADDESQESVIMEREPIQRSIEPLPTADADLGVPNVNLRFENMSSARMITEKPRKKMGRPKKKKPSKFALPKCNFQPLHVGFDCMMTIFEYLSLPDLLKTAQVCKTWKKVSTQSTLWRRVRLRGYRVTDWPAAITCFQERNTRQLDLRGMVIDDADATWRVLETELSQLACVRHVDLPQCPASVLHTITERLPLVQHIAAESIIHSVNEPLASSAKLDLCKFAKLSDLRVLKLRSPVGLVQPSFSFTGGLSELANLQHLHTLCITTLQDLSGSDFSFLGSLRNLHTLSIGDCKLWTEQNYDDLGKLKKLKFLRLESGGFLEEASLGKALTKLKMLESLELFKFVVSRNLAENLKKITSLRSVSIFSETDTQAANVNTNTMLALSQMPFLKILQWGIFDPAPWYTVKAPRDTISFQPTIVVAWPSVGRVKVNKKGAGGCLFVKRDDMIGRLTTLLPDAVIRVFRVPNVSSR